MFSKLKFQELFPETRSRILICYLLLTTGFVAMTVPIFYRMVILQVDSRIFQDLDEEVVVFEQFLAMETQAESLIELKLLLNKYLRYKIPADKTFLIAIVDNKFYRSSPLSVPAFLGRESEFIREIKNIAEFTSGSRVLADTLIHYEAQPLIYQDKSLGVFVIVTIPDEERQEVLDAVNLVIKILLIAWLIALLVIYKIVGIILAPIETLINTTQEITEKQLNRRMVVTGKGELAKLARTFNLMMHRLEIAFKNQNQLLNDVSHELRTPITIVQGHLELLDYSSSEAEKQETINLVLNELDRMGVLVEELLLLAKVEQENFLKLETVNLRQYMKEIYQKVRVLGDRNWQLVNYNTSTLTIDRQRITQSVINLSQNAVQHTQPGDTITIIAKIRNEKLYLGVKDTGIGIPQSEQHQIFERFFQASNSRSQNKRGAGLGLSIVKAIVEKHQGSVQLYSKLGQGSTFYLILPIIPCGDYYESNFNS
ncbi:cell wall metabolism sensor histidine kinase WalK [Gloeocapsa sp. PCC 73106]|uniref:sensor histidine kinase n=1 Tax=Gloeocapsa sp. PCC 73106 TaxID=102232 RepID=UPI00130EED0F|nr:HAMP domain-containing sensor histidine kinase [Gloeocapsa sp. PCC 73106]